MSLRIQVTSYQWNSVHPSLAESCLVTLCRIRLKSNREDKRGMTYKTYETKGIQVTVIRMESANPALALWSYSLNKLSHSFMQLAQPALKEMVGPFYDQ